MDAASQALLSYYLLTVLAAELTLLLVRSGDIVIMVKSAKQRTADEQHRIDRGLRRSFIIELILLVPASATLLILLSPLLLPSPLSDLKPSALATAIGVISYGFPLAAVRQVIIRVALNTLKEFVSLTPEQTLATTDPLDRKLR